MDWDIQQSRWSGYDPDGYLEVQRDGYGDARIAPDECHGFAGFLARPSDPGLGADGQPDPANTHGLLCAFEGDYGNVWPLGNPTQVAKLPRLEKGSVCFYAPGTACSWIVMDGNTGTFELRAKGPDHGETTAPRAGGIKLDVDAGVLRIDMEGGPVIELSASKVLVETGGGERLVMEAGKVSIEANTVTIGSSAAVPLVKGPSLNAMLASVAALFASATTGPAAPTPASIAAVLASAGTAISTTLTTLQTTQTKGS